VSAPSAVGLIANPASGTDIRRLVALGTVFGTQEKVNIVQRILVGLDAAGVDRFYIMPDAFRIGRTALDRLPARLSSLRQRATILDMPVVNGAEDSLQAAERMRDLQVGCLVVLGGDGTNRVVAKACGQVPVLAVSTGTNNVIPHLVEGTLAGLAAGFLACHPENLWQVAYRAKRLEICIEDQEPDLALVDVAVVEGTAVGSRAVWDAGLVRQVILTRAEPSSTGFTSLGGFLYPVAPDEQRGLVLKLGEPRIGRVTAPLAPGLMASFAVEAVEEMAIGESIVVEGGGLILALDGEREVALRRGQTARITLRDDGPWFVDVGLALGRASARGVFVHWKESRGQAGE
jgi:hypothetical protein